VTALAVALAAVGLAEMLLAVWPVRRVPAAVAAAVGSAVVAFAGGVVVGCCLAAAAVLAASVAAEAVLRGAARRSTRSSAAPFLVALGAALVARFATVGLWHPHPGSVFDRWVATLPAGIPSPDRLAYVGGALVFLAAAGNTFVRLLLQSAGGLAAGDAKAPGGGRVIGALERALIFALAVAGEPTAAAIVISAKGILRFAEVRATPSGDVDSVTEYVLVGSLASYALALALVPLAVLQP
jgi:hypothetical protein